jgi:predicted transcriptional regulator
MKIEEIVKVVNAEIVQAEGDMNCDIKYAFAADLLSDTLFIISREDEPVLLITGVTNDSVVKTAKILDIPAVLVARGKFVPKETIDLARREKIIILKTGYIVFVSCGLLYKAGLQGAPWKIK